MKKLKKKLKRWTPRMIKARWLVFRGKAIDIGSNNEYPGNVLSNLSNNSFKFDGVECRSMEGFLQGLKRQDKGRQRHICSMKGHNAKRETTASWQKDQIVWWKGCPIDRQGVEFQELVRGAYQAMFDQNERFREAVMATKGKKLMHTIGKNDPYKTILTESELCGIITDLRESYAACDKVKSMPKRRVYIDCDDVSIAVYYNTDKFPDWQSIIDFLSNQAPEL